MVRVVPPPLTVMIAVRCEVDEEAVTLIVPLFEPEVGEIVSQDESSLLTVQLVFEVIVNVFDSALFEKLNKDSETDKDGEF